MAKKNAEPPEPEASIQKMRDNTEKHAANIEQAIKESAPKPEPTPVTPPTP